MVAIVNMKMQTIQWLVLLLLPLLTNTNGGDDDIEEFDDDGVGCGGGN
jgi:hypothetical protein